MKKESQNWSDWHLPCLWCIRSPWCPADMKGKPLKRLRKDWKESRRAGAAAANVTVCGWRPPRAQHRSCPATFLRQLYLSAPLKNAAVLNQIGEEIGALYGIAHLPADFKKKDGYKRSIELSRNTDSTARITAAVFILNGNQNRQGRKG